MGRHPLETRERFAAAIRADSRERLIINLRPAVGVRRKATRLARKQFGSEREFANVRTVYL